jgi:hypothetical protein
MTMRSNLQAVHREGDAAPWQRWERWAIMAVALACLAPAARWGLPDRARVELLTLGHALTEQERSRLVAVRQAKNEEREAWRMDNAAKAAQDKHVGIFRNDYGGDLILSPDQKLFALGSYLLDGSAHDEAQTYHALASMRPSRLDLNPHMYIYGGTYLYPLGAILMAMKAVGAIHVADAAFGLDRPESIARLYLAGRWMNIVAFLGVLWLVGRMAGRAGGRLTAALAMTAWACSTLAIDQALISKPHLYAAFWALLAVEILASREGKPSPRRLAAAGAAAGWAMGASLVSGLIFAPLAALAWRGGPSDHDDGKAGMTARKEAFAPAARRWIVSLAILGGAMALTFAAANPYVFLRFNEFRATFQGHGDSGFDVLSLSKLAGFCVELFARDHGFPVSLVGGAALAWAAWRGQGWQRRLAMGVLLMIVVGGSTVAIARIALFIGPFICIYGGLALGRFWNFAHGRKKTGFSARSAWAAVALAALFAPAIFMAGLSYRDAIFDEAWLAPARAWATSARLGPGTSIGIYGSGQPHPTTLPPFPFLDARVLNMNKWTPGAPEPDFVLVAPEDAPKWNACPLIDHYHEAANWGERPSDAWLRELRFPSQAQACARVYARGGRGR